MTPHALSATLLQLLKLFARLETNGFAGRNRHLRAGARIAADARLSRTHVEDPKTAQFDSLALGKALFMLSKTVSTAISALVFVMPVLLTTSLMMSSLINACLRKFQTRLRSRIRRDNKLMIGLALAVVKARRSAAMGTSRAARHPNRLWPLPLFSTATYFAKPAADLQPESQLQRLADSDGTPYGLTVNSFTSVSAVPPLVLICIDYRSTVLPHFRASSWYCVNVLADDQRDFRIRFSAAHPGSLRRLVWSSGESGSPVLDGCLAAMECSVAQTVEAGDHAIFIAEVIHARCREGKPLLYFGSDYR